MILTDLKNIVAANEIEQVWNLLTSRMADFGFNRVIYGFTQFKTATSFGNPKDMMVLSNMTSEYMEGFIGSGLYFDAPMVHWASDNVGACSWSVLHEKHNSGTLTKAEERVVEFNRKHDVKAGYTISFNRLSSRERGAIGILADVTVSQNEVDLIWNSHGDEIEVMCNIAHLRMTTLPFLLKTRTLTSRQREVLEWVGDGKTMMDIATIMNLTQATVEKHLRRAREALDADTTTQAVLKASFQNQIYKV